MIPIVFIHSGYQPYLEYSLRQCRLANPESAVYLLSDDANKNRFPFITHVAIAALNPEKSDLFTQRYVHRSTNPEWYELLCFVRWFYVLAFLEERQLDAVFVADSDVMLYKNLDQYTGLKNRTAHQQSAYCLAEYTPPNPYSWLASAHSSFWTRKGLADFCDYVLLTYQTTDNQARLEEKWHYHQKNGLAGGVSDMALLHLYALDFPDRVINLLKPSAKPGQSMPEVFDMNIGISSNRLAEEYELDAHKLKKAAWNPPNYVGYNRILKQNCIFNSLHFQGLSKRYIHRYYQGSDLRLHRLGQEVAHWLSPVLRLKNGLKQFFK